MADGLTGLPTHLDAADAFAAAGLPPDHRAAAIFVDIAGLIFVTDWAGYRESDGAIVAVAGWLRGVAAAQQALLFRVGGDEFLLVFPTLDVPAARELAQRLAADCAKLALPYPPKPGAPPHLTVNAVVTRVSASALRDAAAFREAMADAIFEAKTAAGTQYGVVGECGCQVSEWG